MYPRAGHGQLGTGLAIRKQTFQRRHFRTVIHNGKTAKYDYVNKAKNTLHCMQEGVQDRTFVGLNFNSNMTRADK
jgi:hypothetical protein